MPRMDVKSSMKIEIEGVHGSDRASFMFDRKITVWTQNYSEQKNTFRTLLDFFQTTMGPGYDSQTLGLIKLRKISGRGCPEDPWVTEKFKWAYKPPAQTYHPITFYVSHEALTYFEFWNPVVADHTHG